MLGEDRLTCSSSSLCSCVGQLVWREDTGLDESLVWLARLPSAPEAAKFASVLSDSFKYCLVMVTVIKCFQEFKDSKQKYSGIFPGNATNVRMVDGGGGPGAAFGTAGLGSPLVCATQGCQEVHYWFILKYIKPDQYWPIWVLIKPIIQKLLFAQSVALLVMLLAQQCIPFSFKLQFISNFYHEGGIYKYCLLSFLSE